MAKKKNAANDTDASKSGFHAASTKAGLAPHAGKTALKGAYRSRVVTSAGANFTHSTDVDTHFEKLEADSARWDYGIGVRLKNGTECAFWEEPHPASSTGEVQKMIDKLNWLQTKLRAKEFSGLKALTDAATKENTIPYRWQTSEDGAIRITAKSREARLLAQHGIAMPSRLITLP